MTTKIHITDNYLPLLQTADFHHMCRPLFNASNIDTCLYYRVYNDGGYFHSSTSAKLNHYILSEGKAKYVFDYKILEAMFDNCSESKNKLFLFTEEIDIDGFWAQSYQDLNIKSGLNIIEKFDDHYDGFWFVTKPGKTAYNFFVNHLDNLRDFIVYFKETADDLIKVGETNKIIRFNNDPGYLEIVNSIRGFSVKKDSDASKLKTELKLKRYPITYSKTKTYITASELSCIEMLGKGFTFKETGRTLGISHRTVEHHISNLKNKLGVHSQNQLLRFYHSNILSIPRLSTGLIIE